WRFGQVTQTPAEDLLALSPAVTNVELRSEGDRIWVSGQAVDMTQGLGPLLKELNGAIETRGVESRFFSMDLESDFYVIVYRRRDFPSQISGLSFLKLE